MATRSWLEWILSFLPPLPRRKPRRGGRRPLSPRIKTSPKHDGDKVFTGRIGKTGSPPRPPKRPGSSWGSLRQSPPIQTSQQGSHVRTSPPPTQSTPTSSPKEGPLDTETGHTPPSPDQGPAPITATKEGDLQPDLPDELATTKPPTMNPPKENQPGEDPPRTSLPPEKAPRSNHSISKSNSPSPDDAWNKWPIVQSPETKGLANPGNFCYRNATLQALFHVPGFYRLVTRIHEKCKVTNNSCVLCALISLIYTYWNDEDLPNQGFAPCPLAELAAFNLSCRENLPKLETFKDLRTEFLAESQADAYDFLVYLLDQTEQRLQDEERELFAEMFEMRQEEVWTCDHCGTIRNRPVSLEEARAGLDIAIQPRAPGGTLVEYLQEEFKAQIRAQKCDSKKCKREPKLQEDDGPTRQVIKQIVTAPQILIIRLKRFIQEPMAKTRNGPSRFRDVKINDHVDFEEFLDLSDFAHHDGECLYRLDGVVGHVGSKVRAGHYFSAVRINQPDTEEAQFQIVNDDRVIGKSERNQGDFNEMKYPVSPLGIKASPYILVYSKMSSPRNV